MAKNYASLYIQSEYSLLSSLVSIKKLKEYAQSYEYKALSICDTTMQGAYKFYKMCKEINVKPIIGLCLNLEGNSDNNLLLYAKDLEGYKNLLSIASHQAISPKEVNVKYLKDKVKGILCIVPFFENELYYYYNNYENTRLSDTVRAYIDTFEDLYIGITYQIMSLKKKSNEIISIFNDYKLKCLALDKVAYFSLNDIETYHCLKLIQKNVKIDDQDVYILNELEQNMYLKTSLELELEYQNNLHLLDMQNEIIDKCNLELNYSGYHFPKALVPSGYTSEKYLESLAFAGMKKRLNKGLENGTVDKSRLNEYKQRLDYELSIIAKMGFCDYFLIVQDYVSFAKKNNIYVGPARGSGGGSLVSYAIGITEIDPIKYDLLFERFLNPERVGMPDIDVDFEDGRRDEIFRYLGEKYGTSNVAHTSTLGTFKAKLAIRDVSRIYKLSDYKLNEIMKYISSNLDIQTSINNSPILSKMIDSDEEISKVFRIAQSIEGLPKNYSTHASAIIMADSDLLSYTALQNGINGLYQTQFVAEDLEALGLVKMDILGLRNLSIIKNVINTVKEKENIEIDIRNIDLNDKKVYANIAKGDTLGLFQIEGAGVTNVLKRLKCSSLDDIISATALYRPGPMAMIDSFIARKFGKEQVTYLDESMKDVLKSTNGIIIYQEQIMLIASNYAGYTLGEADILRRAVSKKKAKVLEEERNKFIVKAKSLGRDEKSANKVYDLIEKFASYGFNKSHAVAYALVAYQMAYLKTYHYKAFMAAMMSDKIGSIGAISSYINELRQNKIKVLSPNINKSETYFTFDEEGIYYPLQGISEVGPVIVSNIINERRENGDFSSIDDFINRCKDYLNKKVFAMLVYSASLDSISKAYSKKYLIEHFDDLVQRSAYANVLDDVFDYKDNKFDEFSLEEISALEKEAIGLNLKYNIFIKYNNYRAKHKTVYLDSLKVGVSSYVLFMARRIRVIQTKKKEDMAFMTISDETKELDGVIFPSSFSKYKNELEDGKVYIAKGKLDSKGEKENFIIEDIKNLSL